METWFNLVLFCLAIAAKWLLNSMAIIAGSVISLPFTRKQLILFFDFVVVYHFPNTLPCFK